MRPAALLSSRVPQALRLPAGLRRAPRRAAICSNSSFGDAVNEKAREAQRKLQQWAEEQRVKERLEAAARQAGSKVTEAAEQVQDTVARKAAEIDREYDVSSKAKQAAERVKEAADEVDSKYSVRQRARNVFEDARRKWPGWRRQLQEYFSTPLGTITIILAVWALLATGWFYRLVNAFFFFFFGVMPFLIIPLSTYLQRKAVEEEMARQEEMRRQQEAAQQDPFNSLFGRFGGTGRRRPPPRGRGRGAASTDGPVIDVEWDTVDDK